jgi:hypothetical protein
MLREPETLGWQLCQPLTKKFHGSRHEQSVVWGTAVSSYASAPVVRNASCELDHPSSATGRPRRAGRPPGWRGASSRRPPRGLPHGDPGAELGRRRPAVASRAAPGPPRGRALPGRRDDARAPAWLGGANPERTAWQRPIRPEAHEHNGAGQPVRGDTRRHQPGGRVRVHTEVLALAGRAGLRDGARASPRPPGGLPQAPSGQSPTRPAAACVEGCPRGTARSGCARSTGWHSKAGWPALRARAGAVVVALSCGLHSVAERA